MGNHRNIRLAALMIIASVGLLAIALLAGGLHLPSVAPGANVDAGAAGQEAANVALTQPAMNAVTVTVPAQYQSVYNGPTVLTMPLGFSISVYAAGIGSARELNFGACNDLFAGSMFTYTTRLPDRNRDGIADSVVRFNLGLEDPASSIEYYNAHYYVAARSSIERFDQTTCDAGPSNDVTIVSGLAAGGGHFTRTVLHGPDGAMYISIGSSCNVCVEDDSKRAAISRFYNGVFEVYASGLRNDVGMAFRPGSSELWSVENGRDNLGNDIPPEEVNLIQPHQYYGWPYCYGDGTPDALFATPPPRPDYCANETNPVVLMQAHSAPLSLAFSENTNLAFPSGWKKGFFVAFHGSYNRCPATGYKVVYIPAFAGHGLQQGWNPPTIDFATDDLPGCTTNPPPYIWRPAGLVIGPDGALYVSRDNGDGTIYRITYTGPQQKQVAPPNS